MNTFEELRYLVLAAQRDGNRILASLLKPLGVTPAQSEVLTVLAQFEPLSLQALGQRLVCENGSPSRLVDGLVAAEMIERTEAADDRRRVDLRLTAHGRETAAAVAGVSIDLAELVGSLITETDARAVCDGLWSFVAEMPAGQALATRLFEAQHS